MKFLTDYFNTGTVKQQNKKRVGAMLVCVTAILLCAALVVLTVASIVTAVKNNTPEEDDPADNGGIPSGYTTTTVEATQISQGNLLLIDELHPCTIPPETVSISNRPLNASGKPAYSAYLDLCFLTQDALNAMNAMVADFYAKTQDENLFLTKTEYGTILTLTYYSEDNGENRNSIYDAEKKAPVEVYSWIYQNAKDYGFIRASSAEGQENVFRYVGKAHAAAMTAVNAGSFADYLDLLKNRYSQPSSGRVVSVDGDRYKIYYQAASADTPVLVPQTNAYVISGNNVDGYIITETVSTKTK